MKDKKLLHDLIVLIISLFLFAFLIIYFKFGLFISVILYLFIPTLYLIFRRKKEIWKIVFASLILGILLGMSYDFIAEHYLAYITNYEFSFLNIKLINNTPIGDFIWAFLIPFSIIVFYEHFLDIHKEIKINQKGFLLCYVSFILFIFSTIYINFFTQNYTGHGCIYFIVGFVSCIPLVMLYFEKHALLVKTLLCNFYFLILNAIFEFTALYLNQWSYPGNYFYNSNFGTVHLPIEEVIFWIIPSSMVFIIFWEFFFDDFK